MEKPETQFWSWCLRGYLFFIPVIFLMTLDRIFWHCLISLPHRLTWTTDSLHGMAELLKKPKEQSRAFYSFEQDFGGKERWLMPCHETVLKHGKMQFWKPHDCNSRREPVTFQVQGACEASACILVTDAQVTTVTCSENFSLFQECCFLLDSLGSTFQVGRR